MEYNFKQHLSKEDYVNFVTAHMKSSMLKPLNIVLFIISVGYLVVSPFILGTGDFTFLYFGLGIIALLVIMYFYARRNAAKQYEKNSEQFDMTYKVNDEGLNYILPQGSIEKKWIEFFSAFETEEYLFIYLQKNSGMVILKRDVPTDAVEFIKRKLVDHVNSKRLKLK
jgi:hypothetical protein